MAQNKHPEVEKWITVKGVHIPIFKGESIEQAISRKFGKSPSDKIGAAPKRYTMPDFDNKEDVYKFYKDKFTQCSSVFRNNKARELNITGPVPEKIDRLAKHYTDKWEKEKQINKDFDQKEKQIAENAKQAHQANESTVKPETKTETKKFEFKKVNDIDTTDLRNNRGKLYEIDEERSTTWHQVMKNKDYVLYKDDESGYSVTTRVTDIGQYSFYLKDKDGNIVDKQQVPYYSKDADQIIQNLVKKGQDRAEREYQYSISNHEVDDPYKGVLGVRAKVSDPLAKIKELSENQVINPHFDDDTNDGRRGIPNHHNNCALCTAATIMQLKGYDVEAGIQDGHAHRDIADILKIDLDREETRDSLLLPSSKSDYDWTRDSLRNKLDAEIQADNPSMEKWQRKELVDTKLKKYLTPKGPERAAKAVEDTVKSWPSGAYGELTVTWKGGNSAHSLFIYNDNGEVVIFDSQDNRRYSGRGTIQKVFAKGVNANATQVIRYDNAEIKPGSDGVAQKMFIIRDKK